MKNQDSIDIESLKKLRERFFSTPVTKLGRDAVKSYSEAMENLLKNSFEQIRKKGCALISVGGFGRKELCYGSDIDFMILTTRMSKKYSYTINNRLSDLLWKASLSVGSSVRTIAECIEESKDITVRVNLIDSHFIAGDKKLYEKYSKKVLNYITGHKKEKLLKMLVCEVKKRRLKYPDNYISEPDLKEGVGTLRDYNTICWIDKIVPIDTLMKQTGKIRRLFFEKLEAAANFIFRLRNAVNMKNPKENRLLFELQEEIAELFGYGKKDDACIKLMKQFFEHSSFIENSLDTIIKIVDEPSQKSRINRFFYKCGNCLESDDEGVRLLSKISSADAVVFWFMVNYQLDIGAKLKQFLIENRQKRPDQSGMKLFAKTFSLKMPIAKQLMIIAKLGILSKFIPEFEEIRGLMPHLLFHKYSVEIHSIISVEKIDEIIKNHATKRLFGILRSIVNDLNGEELFAIRLTLLLHDIGKSKFITTGHNKRGAKMFKTISGRFGISAKLAELGAKAIENHLLMNKIIRKRDISDPATIKEFAEKVKDKTSLKWLLMLTYADMSSVNNSLWNEWYEILADQLYTSTIEFFEKRGWQSHKSIENKKTILAVYGKKMPYLEGFSDRFFNDLSEDDLKYVDTARKNGYAIKTEKTFTKLFVWQKNRKRLLSDITGVLFYKEINILAGTTYIIGSDVVDLFMATVPKNFMVKDWKAVGNLINSMETLSIEKMLKEKEQYSFSRSKNIKPIRPTIFIDESASDLYTVIDIKAADRIGLLHDICCSLSDSGCDVVLFKLSTVSDVASDSFYITGPNGGKIFDWQEQKRIIEAIEKKIS